MQWVAEWEEALPRIGEVASLNLIAATFMSIVKNLRVDIPQACW